MPSQVQAQAPRRPIVIYLTDSSDSKEESIAPEQPAPAPVVPALPLRLDPNFPDEPPSPESEPEEDPLAPPPLEEFECWPVSLGQPSGDYLDTIFSEPSWKRRKLDTDSKGEETSEN